ncbi:MAG: zonular occludens toxin domain-containing protein [Raoultibacter sp.]
MPFYLVQGTLGDGKTSYATHRAYQYLRQGRRVAANFPLDFTEFSRVAPDSYVSVLPDVPTSEHFYALGRGGQSEHKAGLLILDEGVFLFNARSWNDKDRQRIIEWLALSRKLGWDVMILIQHIQALDKQIRLLFGQYLVVCRKLESLKFLGFLRIRGIHLAVQRLGTDQHAPVVDRMFYKPSTIGKAYDTAKLFSHDGASGMYSTLTRRLAVLRYQKPKYSYQKGDWQLPFKLVLFCAFAFCEWLERRQQEKHA